MLSPPSSEKIAWKKNCFQDVNNFGRNINYHPRHQVFIRVWHYFKASKTFSGDRKYVARIFFFFMISKLYCDKLGEYRLCCKTSHVHIEQLLSCLIVEAGLIFSFASCDNPAPLSRCVSTFYYEKKIICTCVHITIV